MTRIDLTSAVTSTLTSTAQPGPLNPASAIPDLARPSLWEEATRELPTVGLDAEGRRSFWCIRSADVALEDQADHGETLAKVTLELIAAEKLPGGILARILAVAPADCLIAKAFRLEIERQVLSLYQGHRPA